MRRRRFGDGQRLSRGASRLEKNAADGHRGHHGLQVRVCHSQARQPLEESELREDEKVNIRDGDKARALPAGLPFLPRNIAQPAFAKTDCLNQNACTVEDGDHRASPASSVFAKTCVDDEDGDPGAGKGRKQPNSSIRASAASATAEKRAVEAGKADGKDKCADERDDRGARQMDVLSPSIGG